MQEGHFELLMLKAAVLVGASNNFFDLSGEPEWNENVLTKFELINLANLDYQQQFPQQ